MYFHILSPPTVTAAAARLRSKVHIEHNILYYKLFSFVTFIRIRRSIIRFYKILRRSYFSTFIAHKNNNNAHTAPLEN